MRLRNGSHQLLGLCQCVPGQERSKAFDAMGKCWAPTDLFQEFETLRHVAKFGYAHCDGWHSLPALVTRIVKPQDLLAEPTRILLGKCGRKSFSNVSSDAFLTFPELRIGLALGRAPPSCSGCWPRQGAPGPGPFPGSPAPAGEGAQPPRIDIGCCRAPPDC